MRAFLADAADVERRDGAVDLSASRGEGGDRPLMEAMACGLPEVTARRRCAHAAARVKQRLGAIPGR